MDEVGVYVVRIYRRDTAGIAGVVESVESGEQLPFHAIEELWHAFYHLPSPRRRNPVGDLDEGGEK
jgi:hypothetical protein